MVNLMDENRAARRLTSRVRNLLRHTLEGRVDQMVEVRSVIPKEVAHVVQLVSDVQIVGAK